MNPYKLQVMPFSSFINPTFWHKMTQLKLEVDKLNESDRNIWGFMSILDVPHKTSLLEVDCTSFNEEFNGENLFLPVYGKLLNKNTIEQFKELNKTELINDVGKQFWSDLNSKLMIENTSLLNTFIILSFADLKKYKYFYWFAYPTTVHLNLECVGTKSITEVFSEENVLLLYEQYKEIEDVNEKSFFLVQNYDNADLKIVDFKSVLSTDKKHNNLTNFDEYFFAFADPSMDSSIPGWPLRNYIAFLLNHCPVLSEKTIKVLSFRMKREKSYISCGNSVIFHIKLPHFEESIESVLFPKSPSNDATNWVGWEKNERGKLGPRLSNMASSMDPIRLAETSVDLNLKLMKWRLLTNINLDVIKEKKYLLLGSGTLGCAVARMLLAWGARTITFVDNGKVSYSNPVRQNLFTHEDCLNGGKSKAKAAADNLKRVFPLVNANGFELNIPMPGHPVGDSLMEECLNNVKQLKELIDDHDLVFLLMDSRESRWLPTVLAAAQGKVVINAALGFDSYLVMRHGFRDNSKTEGKPLQKHPEGICTIPGDQLGCYFCNDVTAPGNSLKDRTLDQQCTVTRPGVSGIAASLAVELTMSILQHKDGPKASAFYRFNEIAGNMMSDTAHHDSCLLGIVPHSIRGFLSDFTQVLPATQKYTQCVACSEHVIGQYRTFGDAFLLQVFNSSKHLEDVTGLTEIQKNTSQEILEWTESDSENSD